MAQALIDCLRDPATGDPRSSYTLVWDLHIAGMGEFVDDGNVVEWRWTSAVPPAESGVRHRGGIVKVGGYPATFDGLNGITAAGGTRIDLLFIDHPDNNAGQLCRTEATWTAVLGGTLYGDVDPPIDLPVAKGFEHFSPTGGLCYIGQEAFHYDAVDAEAQTVHVVAQAVLGTLRQNHIVDANRHRAPRIYPEPTDWRDRPAVLVPTENIEGFTGGEGRTTPSAGKARLNQAARGGGLCAMSILAGGPDEQDPVGDAFGPSTPAVMAFAATCGV